MPDPIPPTAGQPHLMVVADADPATRELLTEWLGAAGWQVVADDDLPGAVDTPRRPIALAVVDVPRPRGGGNEAVERIRARHAGVPILAISAGFLPNVQPCGACARLLGVDRVLPKPLARGQLLEAVRVLASGPA